MQKRTNRKNIILLILTFLALTLKFMAGAQSLRKSEAARAQYVLPRCLLTQDIPSLRSQSEHPKMDIHCFGYTNTGYPDWWESFFFSINGKTLLTPLFLKQTDVFGENDTDDEDENWRNWKAKTCECCPFQLVAGGTGIIFLYTPSNVNLSGSRLLEL